MIRCIQVGTVTVQGEATDIRDGKGTIQTPQGPVRGVLVPIGRKGNEQ